MRGSHKHVLRHRRRRLGERQAALLRAGKFSELDIEHIADEVEDVGKSELRELETRMAVLLAHLAKWAFQPARRELADYDQVPTQRPVALEHVPISGNRLSDKT